MNLITTKNLTVSYPNRTVLSNLNFSIHQGEFISVVGENGTGKSTFIKSITGLLPITSGEIIFAPGFLTSHIGFLPQQTDIQKNFPATVWEIVLTGTLTEKSFSMFYTKEQKSTALKHLSSLGMESFKNTPYSHLSGGQQQRVLLARALCSTQSLLILDEPTKGLDAKATEQFNQILEDLNKNQNIAILMVSHCISSALYYSHKILHLETGGYFFDTKDAYGKTASDHHFFIGESH